MFNRLPESSGLRQRRLGGSTLSTIIHLAVIAAAVRATAWTAPPPAVEPLPRHLPVYVSPSDARPPGPASPTSSQAPTVAPRELPAAPPVADFDAVGVPPITGPGMVLDPTDVLFERATRPLGGPRLPGARGDAMGGAPMTEALVDRAIVPLVNAAPRYPPALQDAGLEGSVHAQFVVDTLGRVERGSVRLLEATHELFGRAVTDALYRARFTPAEAGGRKVRQLAEQWFSFRIERE